MNVVKTSGSYEEGAHLLEDTCDTGGNKKFTLGTTIAGEDLGTDPGSALDLLRTSGGRVRQTTVIGGVTTNATSVAIPLPTGDKTFYGQVVGSSGATVTQTQAIYGGPDNSAINGILLGTLTLTGTTRDQDSVVVTSNWSYYYVITTNTTASTGSATGSVFAMY